MFSIPNEADASVAAQAAPDSKDIEVLVAGYAGTGVVSGAAVTAQGSPDMTLAVAVGVVAVLGVSAAVTGGNVTITTAHATNPRFDLVVVDSSGTKSVTAGTAAATPVFPTIPASSVVLAAVYVPANDTAIGSTQIVDKRVVVRGITSLGILAVTSYNPATDVLYNVTTSFANVDATNLAVTFTAPPSGKVLVGVQFFAVDGGNWLIANLREGGADIANTTFTASYVQGSTITPVNVLIPITGLTPGSSHTYVLGAKGNIAFNNAIRVGQSTPHGPGLLVVTDAGP